MNMILGVKGWEVDFIFYFILFRTVLVFLFVCVIGFFCQQPISTYSLNEPIKIK